MENLMVVAILLVFIGAAVLSIRKERKKGGGCIGCPSAGQCSRQAGKACENEKERDERESDFTGK